MSTSSFASLGFAAIVCFVACTTPSAEVNAERTAACADRTNNISCDSCCGTTVDGVLVNNVCTCKGVLKPKK
jgi:hypothetical protein